MTSFSYFRFPGFEDYPIDIYRWTRRRNFEMIWDLMRDSHLNIEPMITGRVCLQGPQRFSAVSTGAHCTELAS